jgi:hypothetical protein
VVILIMIIMSTVTNYNYEFIILQRGVVSRHAHYASVVSTLTNHPNQLAGRRVVSQHAAL